MLKRVVSTALVFSLLFGAAFAYTLAKSVASDSAPLSLPIEEEVVDDADGEKDIDDVAAFDGPVVVHHFRYSSSRWNTSFDYSIGSKHGAAEHPRAPPISGLI